eukprot:g3283.t1
MLASKIQLKMWHRCVSELGFKGGAFQIRLERHFGTEWWAELLSSHEEKRIEAAKKRYKQQWQAETPSACSHRFVWSF